MARRRSRATSSPQMDGGRTPRFAAGKDAGEAAAVANAIDRAAAPGLPLGHRMVPGPDAPDRDEKGMRKSRHGPAALIAADPATVERLRPFLPIFARVALRFPRGAGRRQSLAEIGEATGVAA